MNLNDIEHDHSHAPMAGAPKVGIIPGVIALVLMAGVGLLSVLPSGAAALAASPMFAGFGFVEMSASVGASATGAAQGCPVAEAFAQGVAPVCAMALEE